jgi:DNA-binding HxlR family transcriptional regulator
LRPGFAARLRGRGRPAAAQRRAAARAHYDAYLAQCPARQLPERIGDKWVSLTVNALADGPRRYSDLYRRLAGVGEKTLTQTLRAPARDGLLQRTATVPARVDYALTPLGHDLLPLVQSIKTWAETHMPHVLAVRADYDHHQAAGEGIRP